MGHEASSESSSTWQTSLNPPGPLQVPQPEALNPDAIEAGHPVARPCGEASRREPKLGPVPAFKG